jgi:predicted nucleic acid-binding protein
VKFLVDANVVSEPTKLRPNSGAVEWLANHKKDSAVNPIILGEIHFGILLLPAGRRRRALLEWFDDAIRALRVIEMDAQTAAEWAALLAELRRKGLEMPVKDSLVAATARQHKLSVVTRNVADYRHAGVKLIDPFLAKQH